jgi:hypothetical protein
MKGNGNRKGLSFFRPRGETMRGEVRVIWLILAGWFFSIIGFQLFVYLLEVNYSELLLNEWTIFNLPVHFWLTGHFLPLWFILLCALFNVWMDRHSPRNVEGSLRFMVRTYDREEDP